MKTILFLITGIWFFVVSAFAQSVHAAGNILFILDGSGSMWGQVEGRHKIVIAKEVMAELVRELPGDIRAGLQVYGHRSKGDCDDIEMLVPVGSGDRQALIRHIESITPRGKTPITQSFRQAADQLRALEEETTVVLVSDGEETCEGDPCTLVRELREQGIKIKVHVVGFDVTHDESEQLVCIADVGGGQYYSVENADQLKGALTEVKDSIIREPEIKSDPPPTIARTIVINKPGIIRLSNLNGNTYTPNYDVYEQSSSREIGTIHSHPLTPNFIEVPAGTYKLQFGEFMLEEVEVGSGATKEILLATIAIPAYEGRDRVRVYEQASGKEVGKIGGIVGGGIKLPRFLQVPAGTYKLIIYGTEIKDIILEAGQSMVLEL